MTKLERIQKMENQLAELKKQVEEEVGYTRPRAKKVDVIIV